MAQHDCQVCLTRLQCSILQHEIQWADQSMPASHDTGTCLPCLRVFMCLGMQLINSCSELA